MGSHSPLRQLRRAELQQDRCRRQPSAAYVACGETALHATVSVERYNTRAECLTEIRNNDNVFQITVKNGGIICRKTTGYSVIAAFTAVTASIIRILPAAWAPTREMGQKSSVRAATALSLPPGALIAASKNAAVKEGYVSVFSAPTIRAI